MNNIADNLWEQPVLFESGLCSRFRCTQTNCTECAKVCPIPGAIRFTDEGVEIKGVCIGCDACASACPNGALRPVVSDQLLAERIRSQIEPQRPFLISCEQSNAGSDLVLPCLSRLTEALLLEPLLGGAEKVELLAPECTDCRLNKAAPQWEKVLSLASKLCESAEAGTDRIIRIKTPNRKPEKKRERPDSRRQLFRSLTRWTKETTEAVTKEIEQESMPEELFRDVVKRHHENTKRTHLRDVLHALHGGEAESKDVAAIEAPLAILEVSPGCTGCNVCEMLCPVGALHHSEEGGIYSLDYDPALCSGCGVCIAACFHKAISIRETVDLSVLFKVDKNVTLIRNARRTCKLCQETFLERTSDPNGSPDFCPMCLMSEKRRKSIARQMFLKGIQQ